MNKIQKLTGILIGLILVSVMLFVFDGSNTRQSFEKDLFAVDSTAIVSIQITLNDREISLVKGQQGWQLNDQYLADDYMIKTIKGVLQLVSIKRSVSRIDRESIIQDMESKGAKVDIRFEDGLSTTFYSVGSVDNQKTYFATADFSQLYSMEIPGYSAYVAGYFETPLNQWRDRVLFQTHWRSLQALKIEYANGPNLDLRFEDRFFKLENVVQVDTANLIGYLSSYQYFQINDFLTPGLYAKYDSLFETTPMAKLTLMDINQNNSRTLDIFAKIPGERFFLIGNQAREMMVVDEGRMNEMLKTNLDFKAK